MDYCVSESLKYNTKGLQRAVLLLRFNLVGVEIHGLRPDVVAEGDEVSVYYRSRTKMGRGLSTKTLA